MADNNVLGTLDIKVLANTQEAAESLVTLLKSVNESIEGFVRLDKEAAQAATSVASRFSNIAEQITKSFEPLTKFKENIEVIVKDVGQTAQNLSQPLKEVKVPATTSKSVQNLAEALEQLKAASKDIKLGTVASGLDRLSSSMDKMSKTEESIKNFKGSTNAVAEAFGKLLGLTKELSANSEGLVKLTSINMSGVNAVPFINSLTKAKQDAAKKIEEILVEFNAISDIPLKFKLGEVQVPKKDSAALQSYVEGVGGQLKEYFAKQKVELPPLSFREFQASLDTVKEQVAANFGAFKREIGAVLNTPIPADNFVTYANSVASAVKSTRKSVEDLKAIFAGLNALNEIKIKVTLPSSEWYKSRLADLRTDMQAAVKENLKGVSIDVTELIKAPASTQAAGLTAVDNAASSVINKLTTLTEKEQNLAQAMGEKNVALAEQVRLFKELAKIEGLDNILKPFTAKAGQAVQLLDLSGIAENLGTLSASFEQISNFSRVVAEGQFRIGEAVTGVISKLTEEKVLIDQISRLAADAAKVAQFKPITKTVDEAKIRDEIRSYRSLNVTVDQAAQAMANFGKVSGSAFTSGITAGLRESQTGFKTTLEYLNKLSESSKLIKATKIEVGADVNPRTMQSYQALIDKIKEYVAFSIRANEANFSGAEAIKSQSALLEINRRIISENVNDLVKQDSAYGTINKTVQGLISSHSELIGLETKEFKSMSDIKVLLDEREQTLTRIRQLTSDLATKKLYGLETGTISDTTAQSIQNIIVQLGQMEQQFKTSITALKAFEDDNKNASAVATSYQIKIESLANSLKTLSEIKPTTPEGWGRSARELTTLTKEATEAERILAELSKVKYLDPATAEVLSQLLASFTQVKQGSVELRDSFVTASQEFKAYEDRTKAISDANKVLGESFKSLSSSLKVGAEGFAKISAGAFTIGSTTFLTKDLDSVRSKIADSLESARQTVVQKKDQINTILSEVGKGGLDLSTFDKIREAFKGLDLSTFKASVQGLDESSLKGLIEGFKSVDEYIKKITEDELNLAKLSGAIVFTPSPGISSQLSKTSSEIKHLEEAFGKLGTVIAQLGDSGTSPEIFNRLASSARQSEVTISTAITSVISALTHLKAISKVSEGTDSLQFFFSSLDTSDAVKSIEVLRETLSQLRVQTASLGQDTAFLDNLIKSLSALGDKTTDTSARTKALEESMNLLGSASSSVGAIMKEVTDKISFTKMQNSMSELPKMLENVEKDLATIIQRATDLNNIHLDSSKFLSNFDLKKILAQLSELSKDASDVDKVISEMVKNFSRMSLDPKAVEEFGKILQVSSELRATLERQIGIKLDISQPQQALDDILKYILKIKESGQNVKISIKTTQEQTTETAKSTSAFSAAIEQLVGLRATMRSVTEEGSLLSKMISNYFTNIARAMNVSKESIRDLEVGLTELEDSFVRLRSGVVTWSMGIMMMGQAMVAPFVKAVKDFSNFSDAMGVVQGVTDATNAKMQELVHTTIELTQFSRFSPTEATKGLEELARAGFSAEKAIAALPTVLKLAQGAAIGVGEAATTVTHMMQTYELGIQDVGVASDILVKAANESTATVSDLGHAFTYVGALSKGFGVSLEETMGTLGALANAGFQGTMAGTALRGMMEHLFNPTQEEAKMLQELSERIGGVGLQITDAEGHFVGFASMIKQLEQAGLSSSEALKLFGQRAGPGVAALMRIGSDGLDEFIQKMDTAGGTSAAMAEVMQNTLKGRFEMLTRSLETLSHNVAVGLETPLRVIVDLMTTFVQAINNVHVALGPLATVIDVVAGAVAALMAGIGSLTFAWFLVIVPVTQFAAAVNVFVGVLKGGTSFLVGVAEANGMVAASSALATGALNAEAVAAGRASGAMAGMAASQKAVTAAGFFSSFTSLGSNLGTVFGAFINNIALKLKDLGNVIRNVFYGQILGAGVALTSFGVSAAKTDGILAKMANSLANSAFFAASFLRSFNPIAIAIAGILALVAVLRGLYLWLTEAERAKEKGLKFETESESLKKYINDVKDAEKSLKSFLNLKQSGATISVKEEVKGTENLVNQLTRLAADASKAEIPVNLNFKYNETTGSLESLDVLIRENKVRVIEGGKTLEGASRQALSGIKQEFEKAQLDKVVKESLSKLGDLDESKFSNLGKIVSKFGIIIKRILGQMSTGDFSGWWSDVSSGYDAGLSSTFSILSEKTKKALPEYLRSLGEVFKKNFINFHPIDYVSDSLKGFNKFLKDTKIVDAEDAQKIKSAGELIVTQFLKFKESFINADKDLKSGISSLSDENILQKYIDSLAAGGMDTTALSKIKNQVLEYFKISSQEIDGLSLKTPKEVLFKLKADTSDLKSALSQIDKGLEQASSNLENKVKDAFSAADKYLEAYSKHNEVLTKDRLKAIELESQQSLAIRKKTADMTGTYESDVTKALLRNVEERNNVLGQSLQKEISVRSSLFKQISGGGGTGLAEPQISSLEKFIAVVQRQKDEYITSLDQMIAQSEKLSDAINKIEQASRTFSEKIKSFKEAISQPADLSDSEKIANAELLAKQKLSEAKKAIDKGDYAEAVRLAEESYSKIQKVQTELSKSGTPGEVKKANELADAIDAVQKKASQGIKIKLETDQKSLQAKIDETQSKLLEVSQQLTGASSAMAGSTDKLVGAFERLEKILLKVANIKGVDVDIDKGVVKLQNSLTEALNELNKVKGASDNLKQVLDTLGTAEPLIKDVGTIDFLDNIDRSLSNLSTKKADLEGLFSSSTFDPEAAKKGLQDYSLELDRTLNQLVDVRNILEKGLKSDMFKGDDIAKAKSMLESLNMVIQSRQVEAKKISLIDVNDLANQKESALSILHETTQQVLAMSDKAKLKIDVDFNNRMAEQVLEKIKSQLKSLDITSLQSLEKSLMDLSRSSSTVKLNDALKKGVEEVIPVVRSLIGDANNLGTSLTGIKVDSSTIAPAVQEFSQLSQSITQTTSEATTLNSILKAPATGAGNIAESFVSVGQAIQQQKPIVDSFIQTLNTPAKLTLDTTSVSEASSQISKITKDLPPANLQINVEDKGANKALTYLDNLYEKAMKPIDLTIKSDPTYLTESERAIRSLSMAQSEYENGIASVSRALDSGQLSQKEAENALRGLESEFEAAKRTQDAWAQRLSAPGINQLTSELEKLKGSINEVNAIQSNLNTQMSAGKISGPDYTEAMNKSEQLKSKLTNDYQAILSESNKLSESFKGLGAASVGDIFSMSTESATKFKSEVESVKNALSVPIKTDVTWPVEKFDEMAQKARDALKPMETPVQPKIELDSFINQFSEIKIKSDEFVNSLISVKQTAESMPPFAPVFDSATFMESVNSTFNNYMEVMRTPIHFNLDSILQDFESVKESVKGWFDGILSIFSEPFKIFADTTEADKNITDLKAKVAEDTSGLNIPVTVGNSEESLSILDQIKSKVSEVSDKGITIRDEASATLDTLSEKLSSLSSNPTDIKVSVIDRASSIISSIKSSLGELRDKVVNVLTRYSSSGSPGGRHFGGYIEPLAHFATGGNVFSRPSYSVVPGVGEGDKVPAMLEPGEFIIRKSAVERYGKALLYSLNNGMLQFRQFGGAISSVKSSVISGLNHDPRAIAHFNTGGYVNSPATNSASPDVVEVRLRVGDNQTPFSMKSDRDTAHELLKVLKNVR